MVMEAPPSPDSVGREFVRQYYTLLNKAPTHLHRFYNNQSSFVHGGLDPPNRETSPMIGQKQIHQKIQQLNFQDCHAKIAQVDAQATLGNGVVVQVTGELSNAGQPMRRFTQTFVLAAQSPKKYYVHNDIFRYQDEIISDEECENEARSDPDDELNQERSGFNEMASLNPIPFYNPAANLPQSAPSAPTATTQTVTHHCVIPTQQMPTVNGSVHPDDLNVIQQHPPNLPQAMTQGGLVNAATQVMQSSASEEVIGHVEEGAGDSADNYTDSPQQVEAVMEPDSVIENVSMSNEPKTYATLLKSGGGGPGFVNNTGAMGGIGVMGNATQINAQMQPQKSPASPPPQQRYESRDPQSGQGGNNLNQQRNRGDYNRNNPRTNLQRMPRQDSRPVAQRNTNDEANNFDERRRSQGNFGDSNQLFLGNLPHSATEDDLREIFTRYGSILDLRIYSKANNKPGPPGARAPPNYGFITYETQSSVHKCLAAKPIMFQSNDKNSPIQLNVEEKKVKEKISFGGRTMGGMDNMGPRPRGDGPRRSGPGIPSGQPRSGLGGGGGGGNNGGPMGGPTGGNRSNNFNRGGGAGGPPNRNSGGGPNNTYNHRR